jgi:excisionase family DNA binding protein
MSSIDSLKLLTVDEVATILGVKREYIWAHTTRKEPRIRSIFLGRLRRFRPADVDEYIELMRDKSTLPEQQEAPGGTKPRKPSNQRIDVSS